MTDDGYLQKKRNSKYLWKYVYSLSGREVDDEKMTTMGKYSVNMKPKPATGSLSLALSLDN